MGVLTCFDSWVLVMSLRELFSVEVRVTPKKNEKKWKAERYHLLLRLVSLVFRVLF